jgi:pimeloyl-ACP methyl ester carboxylesterase
VSVNEVGSQLETYVSGVGIAESLKDLDGPNVNPVCRTRLYTHGRRTERALVLLHGFTNCPAQFDALGKRFFEQGWNVLIPRYPRHGYTDRLTKSISELRRQHLEAVARRSADAAAGLGEQVTVAGLSLGGLLAAQLAQAHDAVGRAVLIAPMFGLKGIPRSMVPALARTAHVLPNFYVWWDRNLMTELGPPHGYPRFPTRAYAAMFQIAASVLDEARRSAPRAESLAVVTNAAEPGLDNRLTYRLIQAWRAHGANVDTFEFPAAEKLPHDLIDPATNAPERIERVYKVVGDLIAGDE